MIAEVLVFDPARPRAARPPLEMAPDLAPALAGDRATRLAARIAQLPAFQVAAVEALVDLYTDD